MFGKSRFIVACLGIFILSGGFIGVHSSHGAYPEQPIVIVNPWGAGGLSDNMLTVLRTFSDKYFGQPIIVSPKPGASGTIAHKFVVDAKPNGYTLVYTSTGPRTVVPHFREVPYDPLKDFTDICQIASSGDCFAVRADFPGKTLAEFIDYARKNPGKAKVGQAGTEGMGYLTYKAIVKEAKAEMVNVPFNSTGETAVACAGGKIDAMTASATGIRPMVESGKLRVLASCGSARTSVYPDIKTFKELGINVALDDNYGLAGPAKLPKEIISFIQEKIKAMLKDPQVIEAFNKIGAPLAYHDTKEFVQSFQDDYVKYGKLVKGE